MPHNFVKQLQKYHRDMRLSRQYLNKKYNLNGDIMTFTTCVSFQWMCLKRDQKQLGTP